MRHSQHLRYFSVLMMKFMITGLLLTACGNKQKTHIIGVINFAPGLDDAVEGFKDGMAEVGYIDGENVTYLYEGATDSIDKLDSVAQGLVAAEVDLILSVTTPATLAAKRATTGTDIPVVFVPVTDPVGAGLVKSLKQPGGNTTGIAFGLQEGRRLEWLVQIVPTTKKVYTPYNPGDQSAVLALEMASATAVELGVELITREVHSPEDIMAAIEYLPEDVDAIFLLPDTLIGRHAEEFIKLQLPTSVPKLLDVKNGLMMTSYGFETAAAGKQAAHLADQILRGIKPADLPVEMAEFYLAINLKTAETIGLDISDEILLQADIIVR